MKDGDIGLIGGNGNIFRDLGDPVADLKQAKAVLAARIIAVPDESVVSVCGRRRGWPVLRRRTFRASETRISDASPWTG